MKKFCVISVCFVILLNLVVGHKAKAKENIDINAKGVVLFSCAGGIK